MKRSHLGGRGINNSASSLASCSSVFCKAISSGVGGGSHDETRRRDWAIETLMIACIASPEAAVGAGIGNLCELLDVWRFRVKHAAAAGGGRVTTFGGSNPPSRPPGCWR